MKNGEGNVIGLEHICVTEKHSILADFVSKTIKFYIYSSIQLSLSVPEIQSVKHRQTEGVMRIYIYIYIYIYLILQLQSCSLLW
jgi:hypothetical protein